MREEIAFEVARERLESIIKQVKNGATGLDEAIELLEEGVRLANRCTEKLAEEATVPIEGDGLDRTALEREVAPE